MEIVAHSSITHDATGTHVLASFGKPGADRSPKHIHRLVIQARATSFGRGWPRALEKACTIVALDGTSSGNWAAALLSLHVHGTRSMAAGKSWPVVAGSSKLAVVGRCSKPRLFTSGKLRLSDVVAAIARVTQPAQIQSCFCPHPPSLPHKPH
jgi:hypothetical protein